MASTTRRGNNNRFLITTDPIQMSTCYSASELELDESDVWGELTRSPDPRPPPTGSRHVKRSSAACGGGVIAASLPVNVPDWSKILRGEHRDKWSRGSFDGGDYNNEEDDDGDLMPPHEYLARTRMASLSVHEGVGRTLKGRDLSMMRNAIWEKTGFQD